MPSDRLAATQMCESDGYPRPYVPDLAIGETVEVRQLINALRPWHAEASAF